MSIAAQLQAAALQMQNMVAAACDPSGGDGSFVLSMPAGTYTGIFNEQNEQDPMDPSGIRRVRELWIDATQDQFTSDPTAAPRATLTTMGKTWTVQSCTKIPNYYHFVCRPT